MNSDCIIHHWLVDSASGSLIHETTGEQRRLGEYQLKLLQVLIEHAGQILTRDELNNLVWERRVIGNNSLPNAIHALRVALEDDGKQQKIIKTIPKKGYILELEYCQFITPHSAAAQAQSSAGSSTSTLSDGANSHPDAAHGQAVDTAGQERPAGRRPFWPWLIAAQSLLLLVVLVFAARTLFPVPDAKLVEKNSVPYSNIRLIELRRGWDNASATGDLNKLLGPVLYALNQKLQSRQVNMEVYYYSSGSTLNYTMTLINKCGRQQLAMNIINWRTDGEQLSALIYREGERKIHEMGNCIN